MSYRNTTFKEYTFLKCNFIMNHGYYKIEDIGINMFAKFDDVCINTVGMTGLQKSPKFLMKYTVCHSNHITPNIFKLGRHQF